MKSRTRCALLVISAAALVVGCNGDPDPAALLARARARLAANDPRAALPDIKTALVKAPNSPEARFLLGTALLADDAAAPAELELRKALDLGFPADKVAPPLARALVARGLYTAVISEFATRKLPDGHATADLQTSLAAAYNAANRPDEASAALAAALAAEPGYSPAMTLDARRRLTDGDSAAALAIVESILRKDPLDNAAWKLKGDVFRYATKDLPAAMTAYRKAIEVKADFLPAHSSVMSMLLEASDLKGAAAELKSIQKFAKDKPQTIFFRAHLAYLSKDYKSANEDALALLRNMPNDLRLLELAGAIELQLNSLALAQAHLAKALQIDPGAALARRLLALVYLRSGQPEKSLEVILPAVSGNQQDLAALGLAGQIYMQMGDFSNAEKYFTRAVKVDPDIVPNRLALAIARLNGSAPDVAAGELEAIAASDKSTVADLALISFYLNRNRMDQALAAIDALEKKQPDKPLAASIRGRFLRAQGDSAGARASFERALKIDSLDFQSTANLAAMDRQENNVAAARARFQSLLSKDPKNVQALLALAEIGMGEGADRLAAIELIERAVAANPYEESTRIVLVLAHLTNKNFRQAMLAAQNATAAFPNSPRVLDVQGRAQVAAGESNQAINTYRKMIALQPKSPVPLLRLAQLQASSGKRDEAMATLRQAAEVAPDQPEAILQLALLNLNSGKSKEALGLAQSLQRQHPKQAFGFFMEGDIHLKLKNLPAAATAYAGGLRLAPSTEMAIKLHRTLILAGKLSESERLAASWVKNNPKDALFHAYLGDLALERKDMKAAEAEFLETVRLQPDFGPAYNNLAWVTGQLQKGGAVAYAKKAVSLSPRQPAFLDTLAQLLSETRDFEGALEWQKKAIALQPENSLWKLGLARILIKSGDKAAAQKLLAELSALGTSFPGHPEVKSMQMGLQ
jgi:putative PEP-CTERM system TPR-repeat lipoprotein